MHRSWAESQYYSASTSPARVSLLVPNIPRSTLARPRTTSKGQQDEHTTRTRRTGTETCGIRVSRSAHSPGACPICAFLAQVAETKRRLCPGRQKAYPVVPGRLAVHNIYTCSLPSARAPGRLAFVACCVNGVAAALFLAPPSSASARQSAFTYAFTATATRTAQWHNHASTSDQRHCSLSSLAL